MPPRLLPRSAVDAADRFLAGELTPMALARRIASAIGPFTDAWDDLRGPNGPLVGIKIADDAVDRHHFIGDDVEKWHPSVREQKRAELAAAEAELYPAVHAACVALVAWAEASPDKVERDG